MSHLSVEVAEEAAERALEVCLWKPFESRGPAKPCNIEHTLYHVFTLINHEDVEPTKSRRV